MAWVVSEPSQKITLSSQATDTTVHKAQETIDHYSGEDAQTRAGLSDFYSLASPTTPFCCATSLPGGDTGLMRAPGENQSWSPKKRMSCFSASKLSVVDIHALQ